MTVLSGPLHLFALVLVVSGAQKLVAPEAATTAMRTAGLPTPLPGSVAGRLLGLVEAGIGLAALAAPVRPVAGALGGAYLLLAGFVMRLRARDADASCGCFGSASAPPTNAHVVLDLAGAAVGFLAMGIGVPDIVDVFDHGLGAGLPYLALLGIGSTLMLLGPSLFGALDQLRRGAAPASAFSIRGDDA